MSSSTCENVNWLAAAGKADDCVVVVLKLIPTVGCGAA